MTELAIISFPRASVYRIRGQRKRAEVTRITFEREIIENGSRVWKKAPGALRLENEGRQDFKFKEDFFRAPPNDAPLRIKINGVWMRGKTTNGIPKVKKVHKPAEGKYELHIFTGKNETVNTIVTFYYAFMSATTPIDVIVADGIEVTEA